MKKKIQEINVFFCNFESCKLWVFAEIGPVTVGPLAKIYVHLKIYKVMNIIFFYNSYFLILLSSYILVIGDIIFKKFYIRNSYWRLLIRLLCEFQLFGKIAI